MATVYITEFAESTRPTQGPRVASLPIVTTQTVAIGSASSLSAAFANNTSMVRLNTDAICSVAFGTAPTATATGMRLAANSTEYFYLPANSTYKVAVITNT